MLKKFAEYSLTALAFVIGFIILILGSFALAGLIGLIVIGEYVSSWIYENKGPEPIEENL